MNGPSLAVKISARGSTLYSAPPSAEALILDLHRADLLEIDSSAPTHGSKNAAVLELLKRRFDALRDGPNVEGLRALQADLIVDVAQELRYSQTDKIVAVASNIYGPLVDELDRLGFNLHAQVLKQMGLFPSPEDGPLRVDAVSALVASAFPLPSSSASPRLMALSTAFLCDALGAVAHICKSSGDLGKASELHRATIRLDTAENIWALPVRERNRFETLSRIVDSYMFLAARAENMTDRSEILGALLSKLEHLPTFSEGSDKIEAKIRRAVSRLLIYQQALRCGQVFKLPATSTMLFTAAMTESDWPFATTKERSAHVANAVTNYLCAFVRGRATLHGIDTTQASVKLNKDLALTQSHSVDGNESNRFDWAHQLVASTLALSGATLDTAKRGSRVWRQFSWNALVLALNARTNNDQRPAIDPQSIARYAVALYKRSGSEAPLPLGNASQALERYVKFYVNGDPPPDLLVTNMRERFFCGQLLSAVGLRERSYQILDVALRIIDAQLVDPNCSVKVELKGLRVDVERAVSRVRTSHPGSNP